MSQSVTNNQPVSGAQTIGSLNAISFDQSLGEALESISFSALNGSQNRSIFIVVDANTGAGKNGYLGLGLNEANNFGWWTVSKYYTDVRGGLKNWISPSPNPSTTVLMSGLNGNALADVTMWADGVELTHSSLVNKAIDTDPGLALGKTPYGIAAVDSLIGEVILFDRYLTTEDRQMVEGYLAWKWELQSNLPTDHPFKRKPPGYPKGAVISLY